MPRAEDGNSATQTTRPRMEPNSSRLTVLGETCTTMPGCTFLPAEAGTKSTAIRSWESTSTLLDVINQRDRLTAAQQAEVSAQLALAISLLQLRFETGTLIGEDGGTGEAGTVQVSRLTTLPQVQEERTP